MSTVISFTNQKGGVGKTTFSTQLAYYLATTKKKKGSSRKSVERGLDF